MNSNVSLFVLGNIRLVFGMFTWLVCVCVCVCRSLFDRLLGPTLIANASRFPLGPLPLSFYLRSLLRNTLSAKYIFGFQCNSFSHVSAWAFVVRCSCHLGSSRVNVRPLGPYDLVPGQVFGLLGRDVAGVAAIECPGSN